MDHKEILLKIFLALFMGGIIGAEREFKKKPAGLITISLVCMGATMIAILQTMLQEKGYSGDVTRLSAQVITGVGFIGGGTIMHTKGSIQGITTAALLWISACLGLVIGYGMFYFAIVSFIAIFSILLFLKTIEERYIHKKRRITLKIILKNKVKISDFTDQFSKEGALIKIYEIRWVDLENGILECCFLVPNNVPYSELEKELKELEYIQLFK